MKGGRTMLRRTLAHVVNPSWLGVYIGLYLICLPFLFSFPANALLIGIQMTTGVVIAGVAAAGAVSKYPGVGLINVPLGIFAVALPFLFGLVPNTTVLIQDIVLGVIVAASAVAGETMKTALLARQQETEHEQRPREVGARRIG